MAKIKQTLAQAIAKKMVTDTIGKKISDLKTEMSERAIMVVNSQTPPDILAAYNKYPSYIRETSYLTPVFNGLNESSIRVNRDFPSPYGNSKAFEVDRETYEYFQDSRLKLRTLNNEYELLQNKIYATILSLSTPKNLKEKFPEAYALLTSETLSEQITTVALPIEEIQSLLLKYV